MTDRGAAERACKDPNPIIDGRKANVNLAYLGAKPRSVQTGELRPASRSSAHYRHTVQTQTQAQGRHSTADRNTPIKITRSHNNNKSL